MIKYLIDTNVLIYHIKGVKEIGDLLKEIIDQKSFNISIITKIEFLGWDKHTPEGFEKCKKLSEIANIYYINQQIADKAIEIRRKRKIKLADAVIAATAIVNNLRLVTRNIDDFENIEELTIINPFDNFNFNNK